MSEEEKLIKIGSLSKERDDLIERLDVGAIKIEEARSQGKDVNNWEDYWIVLLRKYEKVCDEIRKLVNENTAINEPETTSS